MLVSNGFRRSHQVIRQRDIWRGITCKRAVIIINDDKFIQLVLQPAAYPR